MKISVIIPTWNRENSLTNTIMSALNQTLRPFEVLVCDDGSTDNSAKIVKKISKLNPQVKWIPGLHSGLPAVPRNKGLSKASGEYVSFLDSDDIWMPTKLQKQAEEIIKSNVDLICSNAYRVRQDINDKSNHYFKNNKYENIEISKFDLLLENKVITSSVMIKKSTLDDVGSFPEDTILKGIEDYALWLRIALKYKIRYINEPLLFYLDVPEQSVRKYSISPSDQKIAAISSVFKWNHLANKGISIMIFYVYYLYLLSRKFLRIS